MSPRDPDLRSDALGTLLSRGLSGPRGAQPSPAVWKRIERRLDPPRGGGTWRRLGRWGSLASPDGRPVARLLAWAAELAFQPQTEDLWIGMPSEDLLGHQVGPQTLHGFGRGALLSPLAFRPGFFMQ